MSEEARTGKRFSAELPIRIHGKVAIDSGTTANMSAAGVIFWPTWILLLGQH